MTRRIGSPRLIGRREEFRRLQSLFDEAVQGRPALALIAGEAGVGKTRLVEEFTAGARRAGATVLVGRCHEFGAARLPLAPLGEMFRQLRRELNERDFERIAGGAIRLAAMFLPDLEVADIGSRGDSDVQDAVSMFERLAGTRTAVVVFEDLHWSDEATRSLLAMLVRSFEHGRLLVIGTYRNDQLPRLHPLRTVLAELYRAVRPERVELEPLSRTEIQDLVEAIAGDEATEALTARAWAHSQGNSFYAEEVVAAALAGQAGIPGSLRDIVEARLATVGAQALTVARAASLAPDLEPAIVAGVVALSTDEFDGAVEELVDSGLLVFDGIACRFRHALVREVIDGTIPPATRSALHLEFASHLAAREPRRVGDIASHYWEAGASREALPAVVGAGVAATRMGAPSEALLQYQRALALWDRLEDAEEVAGMPLHRLLARAASVAHSAREFREASRLLEQAIGIAERDAPGTVYRYWQEMSALRWSYIQGGIEDASTRALEALPADVSAAERVQALGAHVLAMGAREPEYLAPLVEEAEALAATDGSPGSAAWAGLAAVTLSVGEGDERAIEQVHATYRNAVASANPAAIGFAAHWLIVQHVAFGHYARALALADEAIRVTTEWGSYGVHGVGAAFNTALCEFRLGDWDAAERRTRAVLRQLRFADEWADGIATAWGLLLVRRRDFATARQWLGAGWEIARLPVYGSVRGPIAAAIVEMAAAENDVEKARTTIEKLFEISRPVSLGQAGEALASALAWLDPSSPGLTEQMDAFVRQFRDLDAVASGSDRFRDRGRWRTMVDLESKRWHGERDSDEWIRMAARWKAGGLPYEDAYCSFRAAEAMLYTQGAGGQSAAGSLLRAAHGTATRLGASGLDEAIRSLARAGRVALELRAPRTIGATPSPHGLSERELEVLSLLANGFSNGEIGRALVISTKTASVHVSNILRKLDVANRVEAAVLAEKLGLTGRS
jgi:DNA-binding CsgD family transcriptional regulator